MRKPIKHGKVKNRLLMPNMLTALLIVSKNQIQQQAMLQQLMLQPRIRQQRIDLINQQSIKKHGYPCFFIWVVKKLSWVAVFEQSFVLWVGDDCNTDLIVVLGIDIVCSHGITTKAKN